MKRRAKWILGVVAGVVLVTAVAVVVLLRSAPPAVSLTLLEYKRWPHGAMLRLTNGTKGALQYPGEFNSAGLAYLLKDHDGKVRGGEEVVTARTLGAGKAVDFFVRLQPDTAPVRVAVRCGFPAPNPNSTEAKLRWWFCRKLPWLGIMPPIALPQEVWCPTPLAVPATGPKPK